MGLNIILKRLFTAILLFCLLILPVSRDLAFADHTAEHTKEESDRDRAIWRAALILGGVAAGIFIIRAMNKNSLTDSSIDRISPLLKNSEDLDQHIKFKLDWSNFGIRPNNYNAPFTDFNYELRSPDLKIVYEW